MKRICVMLAACLAATVAWAQPAEKKPPADEKAAPGKAEPAEPPFGWFWDLAGSCWKGNVNEKTEHTHCYRREFGRFLRGTAILTGERDGKRQVLFSGDSTYAWNAATKKITYYIWGSDGTHGRLEAAFIGDEIAFPVPSRTDPGKTAYRSVWKRIDKDSFEVRRERPDGDGWQEQLKVTYHRVAKAPGESGAK